MAFGEHSHIHQAISLPISIASTFLIDTTYSLIQIFGYILLFLSVFWFIVVGHALTSGPFLWLHIFKK